MQSSERDNTIIESVERAAPLVQHLAIRYTDDYDELYQVAAEAALKAYGGAQRASNPAAYIHRAIHNALLTYVGVASSRAQRLSDHYLIESLDAPLTSDSLLSLQDVVMITPPQKGDDHDYSRLYALVGALPEIYREVICMRFGLCGYGVHRNCEVARHLGVPRQTATTRLYRGLAMLQQYTELLDLVNSQA